MSTYKLRAELGGDKRLVKIHPDPAAPLGEQFDATIDAIAEILQRALEDETWAKGRITLTDPTGVVVHEMAAKD